MSAIKKKVKSLPLLTQTIRDLFNSKDNVALETKEWVKDLLQITFTDQIKKYDELYAPFMVAQNTVNKRDDEKTMHWLEISLFVELHNFMHNKKDNVDDILLRAYNPYWIHHSIFNDFWQRSSVFQLLTRQSDIVITDEPSKIDIIRSLNPDSFIIMFDPLDVVKTTDNNLYVINFEFYPKHKDNTVSFPFLSGKNWKHLNGEYEKLLLKTNALWLAQMVMLRNKKKVMKFYMDHEWIKTLQQNNEKVHVVSSSSSSSSSSTKTTASSITKPKGLSNTGTKCWLNASLQLLACMDDPVVHESLFTEAIKYLKGMQDYFDTSILDTIVNDKMNRNVGEQQDPSDLFECGLLQDEFPSCSLIHDVTGMICKNKHYLKAHRKLIVHLNIKEFNESLQFLLRNSQNDMLDQVVCVENEDHIVTPKERRFMKNVVIKIDRSPETMNKNIKLEEYIYLLPTIHNTTGTYKLRSLIIRSGDTARAGHYWAFVRRGELFYKVNDAAVSATGYNFGRLPYLMDGGVVNMMLYTLQTN
jgi:hypothetical protein